MPQLNKPVCYFQLGRKLNIPNMNMNTNMEIDTYDDLALEFPQFNDLKLYGTPEEPLFSVQQIIRIVGLPQFRVNVEGFDYGDDYITMKCVQDEKQIDHHFLTESGLYNILFRCRAKIGKKFRRFVTTLVKRKRRENQIDLQDLLNGVSQTVTRSDDHLYIVTGESDSSWIKIGRAVDVPHNKNILRQFPNRGYLEPLAHIRARHVAASYRGEWFKLTHEQLTDLVNWISSKN